MNEPRPASRIVEVRETFTPSEELRDALGEFLAPTMDPYKKESIKEDFVIKSWRRKILHESHYHGPHGEKNYSVQKAQIAYRALQSVSLNISPEVGYSDIMTRSLYNRVLLKPQPADLARKVFNVLNFTENNIREPRDPQLDLFTYLDIPKQYTGHFEQAIEARDDLYEKLKDPSISDLYTISPEDIVTKGAIEHLRSS